MPAARGPGQNFRFHSARGRQALRFRQGRARHALENPSDLHREQKRQFARHVAQAVEERQGAGSFERLVVVAPAVTMGDLRAALPDKVKAAVVAEVVADLTKTPASELPAHLAAHVAL